MRSFPIHTGLSIAALALFLGLARLVNPAIKGPDTAQFQAIVDFTPERVPFGPWIRRTEPAAPEPAARVRLPGASPLLDDSGGVLDRFYQALWRTEKHEKGAVTEIVHYGDSPTTADLITGDIRSQLQARFGNAGHGFILIAKPWAWYQHTGADLSASGWQMSPATHFESHDGMFGLGGVSFTGSSPAHTRIEFSSGHSEFEVWFLRQPAGGVFSVTADGRALGRIDTAADSKSPGFASFSAEPPASTVEILVEEGYVRLFGLSATKHVAGVVYNSLGLNGASITVLSRIFNQSHWAEELSHRNPDLVIINYGTNEADFAAFVDHQYEKELRAAINRIRGAVPDTSILVMSPMDRGQRVGGGEIETMPTIPRIVAIQRRVARETSCGFFDTFTAMGGEGTMAHWYNHQPRLVSADFIHPYPAGGKRIATVFTKEISAGLNRFKLRQIHRLEASNRASAAVP
ncbi:MAG TPA: GDSL-type esterase/lipase family protein [Bryobacteraceae bacterium]|nr:GDSL-type esterase/lipase family protein [Bryobacteraceae bacterium]